MLYSHSQKLPNFLLDVILMSFPACCYKFSYNVAWMYNLLFDMLSESWNAPWLWVVLMNNLSFDMWIMLIVNDLFEHTVHWKCFQQIPHVSPTGQYTTAMPLLMILCVSAVKEIFEDIVSLYLSLVTFAFSRSRQ